MKLTLNRHGRACPDHPRLRVSNAVFKTWMLATRASMTVEPGSAAMMKNDMRIRLR